MTTEILAGFIGAAASGLTLVLIAGLRWLAMFMKRELDEKATALHARLVRIEEQTVKTNGRLTHLELNVAWLMGREGKPLPPGGTGN